VGAPLAVSIHATIAPANDDDEHHCKRSGLDRNSGHSLVKTKDNLHHLF
jgi:hypothetical protein